MDLKQLKEVDPNVLKLVIFEEFMKIDTCNYGFITRKDFKNKYGDCQILIEFFMQKKKQLTFEQYERRFLKAIDNS